MKIYNSLSRQIEDFKPLQPPTVGMYTCGPTVYDFVHIGNFRTYTTADFLLRTLQFNGYQVEYIMNITDVGHLTGDNLGDADLGEDRMEKASKREGKTAWDVAKFYEGKFKQDFKQLNLIEPKLWTRATEYIKEQIDLVKKLEEKGFTYKTSDGIYFDTSKFPDYGKLSPLDHKHIKEGARVAKNEEKINPTDFALWKLSDVASRRQMEWDSPWGVGFPGWHIECSAMSMKYLGETFDIHCGGEDLAATHHPNEIAQSEVATGKLFVKYWVHGAFMMVDGARMSKSLGNNYRLSHLVEKGYDPMDLRYLYLLTHYRQKMNFTYDALDAAKKSRLNLVNYLQEYRSPKDSDRTILSPEKMDKVKGYQQQFSDALSNDLNLPQALAIVWEVVKSNIPSEDKYDLLLSFDEVLGLRLAASSKQQVVREEIPEEIYRLVKLREELRQDKKWAEADTIRKQIEAKGFMIKDRPEGSKIMRV